MISSQNNISKNIGPENSICYLLGIIILASIATSIYLNFLLFHTIAELFSIFIAYAIFIVTWNTRRFSCNNYLLFLGIAYIFVGTLDLIHTLAYKGMNIFIGYDANLPTQLWIASRYLESISLAIAPVFFSRRLNLYLIFGAYLSLSALIIASLFVWQIFPDCFIEGSGLTTFKKYSEYVISLILTLAIIFLCLKCDYLDKDICRLMIASLILTIASEIAFTFYVDVYGLSNLFGHIFKILSFYLIYRAVVVVTLTTPYKSLFLELIESEKKQKKSIEKLEKALEEIKTLRGIIPICSYCKKIRDDKGMWNQLEAYLHSHSHAEFSHGVCPSCYKKQIDELDKGQES